MKKHNTYYSRLLKLLEKSYDTRESSSIAKIYFEDRFGIKDSRFQLNDNDIKLFKSDLIRFENGEPVQYIVQKAFFYKSFFKVSPSVLIPRAETELLVHETLKLINDKRVNILDIGTGSGCIALSIARENPDTYIEAIDISEEAIKVAEENKKSLGVTNTVFRVMDFLDKANWQNLRRYDIIVSNPPYIKKSERKLMSHSTLNFEPELALYPQNEDYLIFYKSIIEFAKSHLNPSGKILCELNEFSKEDIIDILSSSNLHRNIINDLQNKPRVLVIDCPIAANR